MRLTVELTVFGLGAAAWWAAGRSEVAIAMTALVVVQYATSWDRVQWLLDQQPAVS